jgi:hypothetical protein
MWISSNYRTVTRWSLLHRFSSCFHLVVKYFNSLTPELIPSVQRCLTKFFTGDFASWTVHFVNIYISRFQNVPPRCPTSRLHCLLSSHCLLAGSTRSWPSLLLLSNISSISLIHAWKTNKYTNYLFSLLIMYGSSYVFRHYIAIFRERS